MENSELIVTILFWVGFALLLIKQVSTLLHKLNEKLDNPSLGKAASWLGKIAGFIGTILDQVTANTREKKK